MLERGFWVKLQHCVEFIPTATLYFLFSCTIMSSVISRGRLRLGKLYLSTFFAFRKRLVFLNPVSILIQHVLDDFSLGHTYRAWTNFSAKRGNYPTWIGTVSKRRGLEFCPISSVSSPLTFLSFALATLRYYFGLNCKSSGVKYPSKERASTFRVSNVSPKLRYRYINKCHLSLMYTCAFLG